MTTRIIKLGLATNALLLSYSLPSHAQIDVHSVNQKLKQFDRNPKVFMNDRRNVRKFDPVTSQEKHHSIFSPASILSKSFIDQKDAARLKTMRQSGLSGRSAILGNDNPANLVDSLQVTKLADFEKLNLMKAQLPQSPWSDSYWPIYEGGMANRYADPGFPNSTDWLTNVRYLGSRSCSLDRLSPAEKYDLLVGDSNWTLTRAMMAEGQSSYKSYGKVETWMGYCHGWAPASFNVPRPTRAIRVLAADGRTLIPFYPADIKALNTLLWAKTNMNARFVGGRCNQKNPSEDRNGRILSQDCFDTNPGTWHLAIANQLGVSKRGFVFDATYDYEVWNQPVYSYEYIYFNPQTRQTAATLKEAMVDRRHFSKDYFSKYRSEKAKYFVGVVMKVVYVAETEPAAALSDTPAQDKRMAVKYFYDLELDQDGNIIGGEWYHRDHPDFIWNFGPGARPISVADTYLDRLSGGGTRATWSGREPLPQTWTDAAKAASQYGQPLAAVAESLVGLSITGN